MKTVPGRQDGIAALRQRLFFASELVKLAEREAAGDAINSQGLAMACRNGAVLQLHAVLTGMLDDIAVRLRLDRNPGTQTAVDVAAALERKGMVSPEVSRILGLLDASSWLHECHDDAQRCLSSQPEGQRESEPGQGDHDHDHGSASRLIAIVAASETEPLSGEDFARIRRWIAGWKALLDEFLVTLDEF
jgi:hypothetical protein